MPIPELLEVVREWDRYVRNVCSNDGLWFAKLSPDTGEIIPGAIHAGEYRALIARRDLKKWLKRVGLPYHSPHKFRHGNAVYSIKLAKDIAALKAVSQNLMHSNLSITDGVYGILSQTDVQEQISSLGKKTINGKSREELETLIRELIQKTIAAQ